MDLLGSGSRAKAICTTGIIISSQRLLGLGPRSASSDAKCELAVQILDRHCKETSRMQDVITLIFRSVFLSLSASSEALHSAVPTANMYIYIYIYTHYMYMYTYMHIYL